MSLSPKTPGRRTSSSACRSTARSRGSGTSGSSSASPKRPAAGIPRDEELAFLLLELRQFANADGQLSVDFDPVVRESFGELIYAAV